MHNARASAELNKYLEWEILRKEINGVVLLLYIHLLTSAKPNVPYSGLIKIQN